MSIIRRKRLLFGITLIIASINVLALEVIDDIGRTVKLNKPAERIISLAPHITENLFAAGVGHRVVGAVSYSDYPENAKAIPRVGGYDNFNIELILATRPDLIIAWKEGNQKQQVDKLIELGLTVYINGPTKLEDIARSIKHFGILTGMEDSANRASHDFLKSLASLRKQYSNLDKISVFYQTWNKPLITVNKKQSIGQILELCSGENVFANLKALTPKVSVEAVIASKPTAIIASGMNESRPEWLDDWKQWSFLQAVQQDNLFFVPPDIIQRHSPRVLKGTRLICEYLQQVRQNGK